MKENARKGGWLCIVTEGQMASAHRRTEAACARFTAGNLSFTEMSLSGRPPPLHTHLEQPSVQLQAGLCYTISHLGAPRLTEASYCWWRTLEGNGRQRANGFWTPPSPLELMPQHAFCWVTHNIKRPKNVEVESLKAPAVPIVFPLPESLLKPNARVTEQFSQLRLSFCL